MRIVFEPSGTGVHKEQLRVRLDLYAEPDEKSYAKYLVMAPVIPPGGYPGKTDVFGNPLDQVAFAKWLDSLPRVEQLNPSLGVFVAVDQTINKQLLTEWVGDLWTPTILATIDEIMAKTNPVECAHLISPYMNGANKVRAQLSTAKTTSFDQYLKNEVDTRLAGFIIGGEPGSQIERVTPESIDMGSGDLTGLSYAASYTRLDKTNPANATGNIDTFSIRSGIFAGYAIMGTFSGSGTSWDDRDYVDIGLVTSGSFFTVTSLTCDVATDDIIGSYVVNMYISSSGSGGGGILNKSGNQFGSGSQTYSVTDADGRHAMYGTGTESGGGGVAIGTRGRGIIIA